MNIILEICTDATGLQFFIVYYSSLDNGYKPGYALGEQKEENDFALNISGNLEEAVSENMIFKNMLTEEITETLSFPSIFLGTKPAEEEVFNRSLANTINLIKKLGYPYSFAKDGTISEKKNEREEDYREADEIYFAQEKGLKITIEKDDAKH